MKNHKTQNARTIVLGMWILFGLASFMVYLPGGPAASQSVVAVSVGPGDIYAAHCAKCHGADGRAKTAKGKRTGATDFTSDWNADEARGVRIITNGKGEMPSFKGKLSSQEIRGVFGHVLKFRR